jgi:uncharacterized membrane-anchored protein YjiN (DUF445 family)
MSARLIAHLLLITFGIAFILVHLLPPFEQKEFIIHCLEGGLIGALADWFAVTALFRRPLGIPFPHSAIIIRKQKAIAAHFGLFVEEKFLHKDVIASKLSNQKIAIHIGRFLKDNEYRSKASTIIGKSILTLRTFLFSPVLVAVVSKGITDSLRSYSLVHLLTILKNIFSKDEYFNPLADKLMRGLSKLLEDEKEEIRNRVKKSLPWFLPSFVDDKLYELLINGMKSFVTEIQMDSAHPFRRKLREKLINFAESPSSLSLLEKIRNELLDSNQWQSFLTEFFITAKEKQISIEKEEIFIEAINDFLMHLSTSLLEHGNALSTLEETLKDVIITFSQYGKSFVRDLITDTLNSWDVKTLVSSIEGSIGEDLQYIRINGTVLGLVLGGVFFILRTFL